MRSFILIASLILLIVVDCSGQKDSLAFKKEKTYIQQNILPLSLMTAGALISSSQFEKDLQKDIRNLVGNQFTTQLDNYTRYAPLAEMVIADIAGVKAKNHWFDQAKNWTIAWYFTDLLTFKLKGWVRKPRPDNYDRQSFPSGHTSFAFMNAEVLYNEFKDSAPWLAYSGYGFAAATGGMRMMNNAHFLSDVVFSTGLAMFITKLVYWFDPIIKWNPFKKIEGVTLFPQRYEKKVGFYFSYTF